MSSNWINPLLGDWLSSLLTGPATPAPPAPPATSDIGVTFGPPGPDGGPASQAGRAKRGVNLHLMTVAPHERGTTRVARRTELHLALRYLITSWAEHSDAAEALLCSLAFQLLGRGATGPDGHSEIVVEPTPPPLELLAALGLPPRPALVVQLPLAYIEEMAAAPRVLHPPTIQPQVAAVLHGTLLGPGDLPIASAHVEFPSIGRYAETDASGQFAFASVPADSTGQTIRVRARGVERIFQLPAANGGPLTLRMSFGEEA